MSEKWKTLNLYETDTFQIEMERSESGAVRAVVSFCHYEMCSVEYKEPDGSPLITMRAAFDPEVFQAAVEDDPDLLSARSDEV